MFMLLVLEIFSVREENIRKLWENLWMKSKDNPLTNWKLSVAKSSGVGSTLFTSERTKLDLTTLPKNLPRKSVIVERGEREKAIERQKRGWKRGWDFLSLCTYRLRAMDLRRKKALRLRESLGELPREAKRKLFGTTR